MTMSFTDFLTILPPAFIAVAAVILLVVDLFIPKHREGITALLASVILAGGLGVNLAMSGRSLPPAFNGMLVLDGFAVFANAIILVCGLAGIALAFHFLRRMGLDNSEYYPLMLFSTAGMMLLNQAYDLIIVFLAIELLSIPLYVMAGLARPRPDSEESALKYFLLGTFSSAFLLYGIALIYGGTAHTNLIGIVQAVSDATTFPTLFLVGASLMLVGLGFKLSAVPFHMWTPDVYQGAPTPVTGWMAVAVKVAGLAALLRIFVMAFPSLAYALSPILAAMAALTMIVGNLVALVQNNIKRLLAYSSIANVGYLLMAFVPFANAQVASDAIAATLFYMVGYTFTSFAAWAVVAAAEKAEGKGLEIDDFAGLGRKYPLLGIAMTIAMLSFTGIPPTLGFWGKFYIFRAAVEGGSIALALVGLLTSLLSAYYYLRVVVVMYMKPGEPEAQREPWVNLLAAVSAGATLLLAFFPGQLLDWATQALLKLI
ncbi:MAG: NADH-quinone oxidoreductase subunit N [Anaerolineae bacterium]|nr:NADH-quinone oxidoreductase subunit N [Anaerolineae bacterium]